MASKLEGKVVTISAEGTAVTDVSVDRLVDVPRDESVAITCEGHTTNKIFPTDHQQAEMTLLAFEGPSGFLEICLVGDSVASFLGIHEGSTVTLKW